MKSFTQFVLLMIMATVLVACASAPKGSDVIDETQQPLSNELTAIEVTEGDGQTTVALSGTVKPTYTVVRLSNPQRLIVDLADCRSESVDAVTKVNDGLISVITTNQFQDKGRSVARVMIACEQDSEFVTEERNNSVLLHLTHPAGFVSKALPNSPFPVAEVVEKSEAIPEPAIVAPVELCPEGEPVVLHSRNNKVAKGKITALSVSANEEGASLSIKATRSIPEDSMEVLRLCNPDRIVVDLYGLKNGMKKRSIEGDGEYIDSVRLGSHKDKLRIVLDLNRNLPEFDLSTAKKQVLLSLSEPVIAPVAIATAPVESKPVEKPETIKPVVEEQAKPETAGAAEALVANHLTTKPSKIEALRINGLDFKHRANYSTIELSLSGPATYRLVEASEDQYILELSGVELPQQFEQSLDTSEFDSPVTLISSYMADAKTKLVKVAVQLRETAPNQVQMDGNKILWRFDGTADSGKAGGAGHISLAENGETVIEYEALEAAGLQSQMAPVSQAATSIESNQRISLELKNTDILDVLRLIADVSKLNIITSDDVSGSVTVRLLNVPWQQALDIILRSKGLGQERQGNIIRVAPLSVLQAEREMRINQIKAQRELEPLSVRLIPISYSDAGDLLEKVKDLLSSRGTVNFDKRTNVIIVKDIDEVLSKAESLVSKLDLQTPQVMIEAKIVEADVNNDWGVGLQWGGYFSMSESTGNPTGLVFPSSMGIAGNAVGTNSPGAPAPPNWIVNVPTATDGTGGIGFTFSNVQNTANLSLRLSAYESSGFIKIVSSPRISTLDNKEASIKQGLEIPIITISTEGLPVTKLIEALLELKVTPHITADGSIMMKLEITKEEPDFSRVNALGDPAIIKKEAQTEVLVRTGETTVIGGIYTKKENLSDRGVPGLSKIPVLGWLFKSREKQTQKTELLIFVTPRIINRSQSSLAVD